METKRCFIALELPREVLKEIKKIQELIRKRTLLTGKFIETENLHLTLKFLGEIDEDKIKEVKKRLREIKFNSFDAEFGEVGVFNKKFIRIIWIKLKGRVFELQKEIDDRLKDLFKPEERFMSHITISRVRHVKRKKELIEYLKSIKPIKNKFKVECFFLKSSELLPEGLVYEDIGRYNLYK